MYNSVRTPVWDRSVRIYHRHKPKQNALLLNEEQMQLLIESLENHITEEKGIDDVTLGPYSFSFSGKIEKQQHPYSTGVTYMGYSESYTQTEYTIISLKLEGAFNGAGERISCNIPCNKIKHILNANNMIS